MEPGAPSGNPPAGATTHYQVSAHERILTCIMSLIFGLSKHWPLSHTCDHLCIRALLFGVQPLYSHRSHFQHSHWPLIPPLTTCLLPLAICHRSYPECVEMFPNWTVYHALVTHTPLPFVKLTTHGAKQTTKADYFPTSFTWAPPGRLFPHIIHMGPFRQTNSPHHSYGPHQV